MIFLLGIYRKNCNKDEKVCRIEAELGDKNSIKS
jgi:hypothetical protein